MPDIRATALCRRYNVVDRRRGLGGALRDLVRPDAREHVAVANVDFHIAPGEAVALLGPNGAGKSTTLKMLCGILRPTSGELRVGGLDPWADRVRHVRGLGVVFGQRTQLWWDLAVIESFDLLAAMFDVPAADYRARLDHFDSVLGIGPLLRTPVRQLSLGERMRCDLAAALLHAPPLLVLDEPSVGLDVAVKLRLRAFLTALRDSGKTTIVLASHDLADVTALCPRVLVLAEGALIHDGSMDGLLRTLGGRRTLTVTLTHPERDRAGLPVGFNMDDSGRAVWTLAPDDDAPALLRAILGAAEVADLQMADPPVESLVARLYEERR